MEKMKASRFNLSLGSPEVIFNSFTRGYGRLNPEGRRIIDAVREHQRVPDDADSQVLEQLKRGSLIVPCDLDEVAALRTLVNRQRFSQDHFSMIVCPTLECNLRCSYCYERHSRVRMTRATETSLVSFAASRMERAKTASILWYGGEPLLELGAIARLQRSLMEVASQRGIEVTSSIVTNGTLLTAQVAEQLRAWKVTMAQVTLDGPRSVHDARRPLVNGKGTYDSIVRNLAAAAKHLQIAIRVNVDRRNLDSLVGWLPEIAPLSRSLGFGVHFAPIEAAGAACASVAPHCFAEPEFGGVEIDLETEAVRLGIRSVRYPTFSTPFCSALADNSFLVEPDGSLQKCLMLAGDSASSVGRLTDSGGAIFNPSLYPWLALDPVPQGACEECAYLPTCMGGCPAKRVNGNAPTCARHRGNLAEALRLYAAQGCPQ